MTVLPQNSSDDRNKDLVLVSNSGSDWDLKYERLIEVYYGYQ